MLADYNCRFAEHASLEPRLNSFAVKRWQNLLLNTTYLLVSVRLTQVAPTADGFAQDRRAFSSHNS